MAVLQNTLHSFLNDEEKKQISEDIIDKLNTEYVSKVELGTKLQIDLEKCKIDYEQQKFILEREITSIQEKFEEECRLRNESKVQRDAMESKFNEQDEQIHNLNEKVQSLTRQLEHCQSEQDASSSQATAMARSLESKTKLLEELKDQVTTLEEYLSKTQKSKCDLMIQCEEASALQIQFQFKQQKFDQEKNLRSRQLSIMQQQLEERAEEVLTLRKDNSNSILSLQSEISHCSQEVKMLREEKESFQKILSEKTEKNQELLSSLNDMRMSEAKLDESFRQELMAQKRIATIHEASSDDQKKRCEELEKGIEELRQLLREASEQYGALDKAKEKAEEEAQHSLTQSGQLIKDLQEELNKVNELMKISMNKDDIMSETFPAASAASQLMSKGLTLSQLYIEYLNTSERLYKAEDENKRLSRYVEQILEEIHEKGPYLKKQRDDYARALETINALHTQIEDSIEELEKQKLDSEEAKRRAGFIGRENDRLCQQVKDLSRQVSVLVTQVEAARAGLPPPSLSVLDNYNEMTASDIIDQQLVRFRDVFELQAQNQKLLASLRELTGKLETAESDAITSKIEQLQDELSTARKELSELRFSREKMQSIVDNVSSQRDMYRTIVNQQGSMTNGKIPDEEPVHNKIEYQKLRKELDDAGKEVTKYKKEYVDYRDERNKNQQMEKSEHDRIKTAYDKTKNENIRLLSHAEYNDERLKTLQNNCEAYKRQINAVEEKNSTLQTIVGRHESSIENLHLNVLSLTKRLAVSEVQASNLQDERNLLKESETHLLVERDSLNRSQYSHSILLSNLEAIKNNLNRTDSETKMRYENKIIELTEQCSRLKTKIEANTDLKEANLNVLSVKEQVRLSREETDSVRKSLSDAEHQILSLRQQVHERTARGETSPILSRQRIVSPQGTPIRSSPIMTHSIRELQVQLNEEKAKTSSLLMSVDQNRISTENLKKLTEELEKQLNTSSENNKAVEDENASLNIKLKESMKNITLLKEKLVNAEENEVALRETKDHQLLKMTEELEERENESEEAHRKLKEIKISEDVYRNQMKEQAKLAEDMQDKYEKEVMLHGADLQAMASLKESLSMFNDKLQSLTIEKIKAVEVLEDTKSGFEKRESDFNTLNETLKVRVTELEDQNKSILDQFMTVSDKMATIQSKLAGDSANTSFTEDEARSSDQLKEVIKYLRREREIATSKAQMSEAESQRLSAQKISLESQIASLDKHLKEEREKNQSSTVSAGQYEEILRKTSTMEALMDSNKLLRDEKNKLEINVNALQTTKDSLEAQIKPNKERIRILQGQSDSQIISLEANENEKVRLKKRIEDLVESLNKSKPEDMLELQEQLNDHKKKLERKEVEFNRMKNMSNNLSKNQQFMTQQKNQARQALLTTQEELKKSVEEAKKSSKEKIRLHQQLEIYMEKSKVLERTVSQNDEAVSQLNEVISQHKIQLLESRQKEEQGKKNFETMKQTKDASTKQLETEVQTSNNKLISLEKQVAQIRKIAQKYKKLSESPKSDETVEMKKLMDDNSSLLQQIENHSLELERLRETITNRETEIKRMNALLTLKGEQGASSDVTDEQRVQDLKSQLAECESGKSNLLTKTKTLDGEKERHLQEIEILNKKLQMQQKIMENLQKQSSSSSKSPSTAIEKPSSDPPPTANIKPMAAPVPTASPRCPTPIGSRTIPTASVRPMAPSVVVMPILDTHDGAVSSTVTLPQATVTPTPVASTCTPTQATLTATISPMTSVVPQTSTLDPEEMSGPSTSTSGGGSATTSDDLISEALAAITAPEERGGQKRKLDIIEEEDEENKRVRTMEDDDLIELATLEGEPSSSSHRNDEVEVVEVDEMILSSDEEDSQVPQQSEAEAEIMPSSAGAEIVYPPMGLEVPSSRPEPSSSSRQSLAPFATQYEEDDRRTVPSTPTLFVPRPCEGATGVSTPQVPSQGGPFEFGSQTSSDTSHSNEGLSQIADGGNIDVTRMDLSQLEQRSPAVESNVEGNISSSAGESEVIQRVSASILNEANEAEADASLHEPGIDLEEISRSEQVVVSSQIEDTPASPEEIEIEEEENEVEEIEEQIIESLDEDNGEDIGIGEEVSASSTDEPPVSTATGSHTRNIVPIVFDQPPTSSISGAPRGRRRGGNFQSPQNYHQARGTQWTRRPPYGRGGSPK